MGRFFFLNNNSVCFHTSSDHTSVFFMIPTALARDVNILTLVNVERRRLLQIYANKIFIGFSFVSIDQL